MLPSKNMMDYMTEINRLFPETTENELHTLQTTYNPTYMNQSPLNPTMANHSSSSADSTSPESYPELSGFQFRPRYTPMPDQSVPDTPFPRRQRPIMGRKIMTNPEHGAFEMRPSFNQISGISPIKVVPNDDLRPLWPQEVMFPQTPPKPTKIDVDQVNYGQNVFYELFPSENRRCEFRTPDKNVSSPLASRFSFANISPTSALSVSPVSPLPQRFMTPPPLYGRNYTMPPVRRNEDVASGRICSFCRKNGETPQVYMTHTVRARVGNKSIVTCPILRSHVCTTCHATGDDAHTITYCPVLRSSNNGLPLQSTTITLKNTRVKSNGRKRY